jgi:hypothetical protein
MRQRPANGRHGFVLHDACWCLLEKAFDTERIPLERFIEVCDSLPFPLRWGGVCWDHDYGGLALFDAESHYPWEDHLESQTDNSMVQQYAQANPYNVPEISRLLEISYLLVAPSDCPSSMSTEQGKDCFMLFPWEILESIAALLSTKDALILRLASRSFRPILTSQNFWASRFEPGHERDFIFETRNSSKGRDWRHLYRYTSVAHASPELQNRRRIWGLIQLIREYLGLRTNDDTLSVSADVSSADFKWTRVGGDIWQEPSTIFSPGFNEGCRIFHKVHVFIPKTLSKIAFSIIRAGEADYVVGLRLISVGGSDNQLGYRTEGKEVFFAVTALRGFAAAVGPRGIRALQVICDDGTRSPWFGRPKDSPITERLQRTKPITALEVGFDVSSIVHH